jgi:flagellar basal-body rod modification protein FlgD
MTSMDVANTLSNMVNSTAQAQAENNTRKTGAADMDQNAFLQLLMAQMKYQDPLKPMDSSQFLAQQAQFTQISELQKLNKTGTSSNEMMQASSLIGKEVGLIDPDNSQKVISGLVDAAVLDSTGASILIGGKAYPLDSVVSIQNAGTNTKSEN